MQDTTENYLPGDIESALIDYGSDRIPAWVMAVNPWDDDHEHFGYRAWRYLDGPALEFVEESGPVKIHARIEEEATIPDDGGPVTITRTGYVVMDNLDSVSPENALRLAEHLVAAVNLLGTP